MYPRAHIIQQATNRQIDPVHEGFDLCLRAHSAPLAGPQPRDPPLRQID